MFSKSLYIFCHKNTFVGDTHCRFWYLSSIDTVHMFGVLYRKRFTLSSRRKSVAQIL